MADRISEIKSLLDRLAYQLTEELETQREEIEILKGKIAELEKYAVVEQVITAAPVMPVAEAAPMETFAQSEPERPAIQQEMSTFCDTDTDESCPDEVIEPEPARDIDTEEPVFTVTDLNDLHSTLKTTVSDLYADRNTIADVAQSKARPWMVDIPGPKVEMIQSALSFNDRLTFIRDLFDGDSEQFNITLDRINETSTFDEVVSDMRDAYPEWDEGSPLVYRFYMEVRRRFRD